MDQKERSLSVNCPQKLKTVILNQTFEFLSDKKLLVQLFGSV